MDTPSDKYACRLVIIKNWWMSRWTDQNAVLSAGELAGLDSQLQLLVTLHL